MDKYNGLEYIREQIEAFKKGGKMGKCTGCGKVQCECKGGKVAKGESGIHIKESHKGRLTAKAKAAGMGTQEYARHVMANKGKYDSSTIKQANFAKNASKWHH